MHKIVHIFNLFSILYTVTYCVLRTLNVFAFHNKLSLPFVRFHDNLYILFFVNIVLTVGLD